MCSKSSKKKWSKKTCFGIKKCLGKFYLDKDKFLFEKKKCFVWIDGSGKISKNCCTKILYKKHRLGKKKESKLMFRICKKK